MIKQKFIDINDGTENLIFFYDLKESTKNKLAYSNGIKITIELFWKLFVLKTNITFILNWVNSIFYFCGSDKEIAGQDLFLGADMTVLEVDIMEPCCG